MEERAFHPLDYVSVLHRRKWWLIVPLAAALVVGALLALLLPRQYLSQATIGVAAPRLSPDLLRGVGSLDKDERQRAISQQLLSPTVLQRVVREEKINPAQPVEVVAGDLRANVEQNIAVPTPIGKGNTSKGLDSIILGYTDSDPARAQRITNRLAYVFVEENSRNQIEQTENTSELLSQQLHASEDRLTTLEGELKDKKQAYMGRLPDQVNANVQMVNGLRSQFESISTQLRGEQDRLTMIETQLAQMTTGSGSDSLTASGLAAVQNAQRRINDLQQQLTQDRALGYTDKHPEVVRLQAEIKQATADLAAARREDPSARDELLKADPLYRQAAQERDATQLRIRDLRRDSARVQQQIASYQSRVDAAPTVEQELASLQREYDLEKSRYTDLTNKYHTALMAEDVTRKQGGDRFTVLYPASLPTEPVTPNRPMILALAVAAGLVLGVGAAIGREFLDRSVHDARALQTEFEIPVLGEIPRIAA